MRRVKKIAALLGVGALMLTGTASVASPAYANYATCMAAFQVCLNEDGGGQGDEYGHNAAAGSYELGGWDGDNEISSVTNGTYYCVTLYSNDGWGGRSLRLAPRKSFDHLSDQGWDNDIESYKVHTC